MVIALCGYMGSGKSTLGKMLAKKLAFDFVDLDDYIEKKENMSIPQIFADYGEAYFRQCEYSALASFLSADSTVLSLGGGVPIADENKKLLKGMFVVYIDSSFEDCYKRIKTTDRPIVKQKNKSELEEHYNDRVAHYKKVANLTVYGNNLKKMTEQIVRFVKEKI